MCAILLAVGAVTLGPSGCAPSEDGNGARAQGTDLGISAASLDKTVKPGDDFYAYANGSWMRTAKIPDDKSSTGAFRIADDTTQAQLAHLVDDIVKGDAAPDSDPGRIRTYYTTYVDTKAIDAAGLAPARPDLDRIAAIADKTALSRALGGQVRADVDPLNATDWQTENLFGLFVTQSLSGSAVMPYLLQGGLGMPGRDYYLSPDPKMAAIRDKYRAYLVRFLGEAGFSDAAAMADRIYALEVKIAAAHASLIQSSDFRQGASEWTRADFARKAPGIDWPAFFTGAGLAGQDRLVAYHAGPIAQLAGLVGREPLEAWKDWLMFHQLNSHADVLPSRLDAEHFGFYEVVLSGTAAPTPRSRRGVEALNASLGDALGKLYVEQYFPPAAKAEIESMVGAIKEAFAARIGALDWMADTTRQEALAKVRQIEVGIGYPDKWTDYSALVLIPGQAYANEVAAEKLRYSQQLGKIGKPLDRREWWMNAQLVNAVNLPVQNALNFPAAILQRPFFDAKADPAFNYGAIGAVIGHEISHSFDDNGAAFDANGKLRNWWTAADLARFQKGGAALATQYDRYSPFPGIHVNGKQTLGENIADLAGLAAAYDAYRASLKGKEPPVIDGFTGDQRFFIAFAQSWATKMREEALRGRLVRDGHAPGQYRAQTVRNIDAWYRAFDVQSGDRLYLAPEERVHIW